MANHKFLILTPVAFAAVFFCSGAHAGYAQLNPPANWAAGAVRVATNDVSFTGGVRSGSAVINVAGKAVAMPAAYRFAANASRLAAGAAYLNPGVFTAIAVGTAAYAAYEWFTDEGLEVQGGVWKKNTTNTVIVYEYAVGTVNNTYCGWFPSKAAMYASACYMYSGAPKTPEIQRQVSSSTTTESSTITKEQFEDLMAPKPIPVGVPQVFPVPDFEWPVEPKPIINPSPAPVNDPLAVPSPQPMRVPMGEPQPIPGTDPQKWKVPVVDVVPAPLDSDPWRVDLQPKDVVKETPTPYVSPQPVPVTPPAGETTQEKPSPDLCAEHPEILACQVFTPDEITATPVVNQDRDLSIQNDSGWATGGSCPADRTFTVRGFTVAMPFTLLCDFAAGIRPIVIALAYLSAAAAFIGFGRR